MSYYVLHICQLQFYYINTYFQRFLTIIFVRNIHSSIHCRTFTLNNTWNIKRPNKQTWNKHWECTNASQHEMHIHIVYFTRCVDANLKRIFFLCLFFTFSSLLIVLTVAYTMHLKFVHCNCHEKNIWIKMNKLRNALTDKKKWI